MAKFKKAEQLLHAFKGDAYIHGMDVLGNVGPAAAKLGTRAALVCTSFPGSDAYVDQLTASLKQAGVDVAAVISGPAPNAPQEDLYRITDGLRASQPDVVLSFGGGSTIDAAKAGEVLRTLGGDIEDYFGTAQVSAALEASGKTLSPHVAVQTAASSAAHLTKYSNITNVATGQKKLIVDDAIVPQVPVFDYGVTLAAPPSLTADGALDGIAHSLEVFYGAINKPYYAKAKSVALESIALVVKYLPQVMQQPDNTEGRMALGLGTDLGGYSIMIGGTNGGHLTSFSLVDVVTHGRACAIMNPYYTVMFSAAIEDPLRSVGAIFKENGYTSTDLDSLKGQDLGMAVAQAMLNFGSAIGFPTTLGEIPGFSTAHIERALAAAKNPQLKMKLENMPTPMTADMVDEYMGSVLEAAHKGDLSLVKPLV